MKSFSRISACIFVLQSRASAANEEALCLLQTVATHRSRSALWGPDVTSCDSFAGNPHAYSALVASVASQALECALQDGSVSAEVCAAFTQRKLGQLRHALTTAADFEPVVPKEEGAALVQHQQQLTGVPENTVDPASVIIVSVCFGDKAPYDEICRISENNYNMYAKTHGYQLLFVKDRHELDNQGRDDPKYTKILAMQKALATEGIKWAWWMDSDSVFMNMSTSLVGVLPSEGYERTISPDLNCFLNNGHFGFRNSEWSRKFLQDWWNVYPVPQGDMHWVDQASDIYLLTGSNPQCRRQLDMKVCCKSDGLRLKEVEMLPQSSMNSYLTHYKSGDFILHFAGMKGPKKAMMMRTYSGKASASLTAIHTSLMQTVWDSAPGTGLEKCFS